MNSIDGFQKYTPFGAGVGFSSFYRENPWGDFQAMGIEFLPDTAALASAGHNGSVPGSDPYVLRFHNPGTYLMGMRAASAVDSTPSGIWTGLVETRCVIGATCTSNPSLRMTRPSSYAAFTRTTSETEHTSLQVIHVANADAPATFLIEAMQHTLAKSSANNNLNQSDFTTVIKRRTSGGDAFSNDAWVMRLDKWGEGSDLTRLWSV